MFFEKNMAVARQSMPWLDVVLDQQSDGLSVSSIEAPDGSKVPMANGLPLADPVNPLAEARDWTPRLEQQRLIIFGLGFGHHVRECVRAGLSPMVYEPSVSVLRAALESVDMTDFLPYISIHAGAFLPDIPRLTKIVGFPRFVEVFNHSWELLQSRVIRDYPAKTDDIEEGVYSETYRNVTCLKNPCDLVAYQMLLTLVRPTLILEIGTCRGGSALLFADFFRLLRLKGRIHTYDIVEDCPVEVLSDPLITCHSGGWKAFNPSMVRSEDRVLVIEDSAHTYENTIEVMWHFADYVTPNSYFIVEDGAAGLVRPSFNGGAIRAIEEFLKADKRFEIDSRWENFFGSKNSNCLRGFLRRKL